ASWNPFAFFLSSQNPPPATTGFSEEMDLNRTGTVKIDETEAFTVRAQNADGGPKTDLSGEQRWRGTTLDHYHSGVWSGGARSPLAMPGMMRNPGRLPGGMAMTTRIGSAARTTPQTELPDLGRQQYFLEYQYQPRKAGGLFIAEPVLFGPPERR